jgi:hypothetical protein
MRVIKVLIKTILHGLRLYSLRFAIKQQGMTCEIDELRRIVPDISEQESRQHTEFNEFYELKRRGMHAFQCRLMKKALGYLDKTDIIVVDIGDSAGTHMMYLAHLVGNKFNVETLSVNLDARAVAKIRSRGLKAILKRAEELQPEDFNGRSVDLFTSFEMVEHLHNPALFFRRLAKRNSCNLMVLTVPFLCNSRVGLHNVRHKNKEKIFAEDEHIFELSPSDWTLLFLHAGWRVKFSQIYYQYPRHIPFISYLLCRYWRSGDFEGFWGAILEKDTTYSDLYMDWED